MHGPPAGVQMCGALILAANIIMLLTHLVVLSKYVDIYITKRLPIIHKTTLYSTRHTQLFIGCGTYNMAARHLQ